ncbi:MAG: 3-phosphoserine/phosphohydroxythreonine transaminase [Candidatus Zixiibacteriota bacterium]
MTHRVYNFNPGPATLPLEVLRQVQQELLDYRGTGMSILESSHRSPEYEEINESAISLTREILGLDDRFHVLFLGGGASTQFAMIPMNFLTKGKTAVYVDTGSWSAKAIQEAQKIGRVHIAFSSKDRNYTRVPQPSEIDCPTGAAYLHITTNNTIKGTQFHAMPDSCDCPLIADMSSDIASRRLDFAKFALVYAGAQKNLGPAGVTVVIIRDDLLAQCRDDLPTMFSYKTHAEKKSLYNTPPVFGVYMVKLILEWIRNQGGLEAVEKANVAKKDHIYQVMDRHSDFFHGTAETGSRSWMNITMRLPSEDLEKKFVAEANKAGFVGLKGHRSVGGVRVSMYNALPLEGAEKLAEFMEKFREKN